MKRTLLVLIATVLSAVPMFSSSAATISIAVGDQPYYIHGPGYYVGPTYYVWVPGHWAIRHGHRVWVHGHYALR